MLCTSMHLHTYNMLPVPESGFICLACSVKIAIEMTMAMSYSLTRTLSSLRYVTWLWHHLHTAACLFPSHLTEGTTGVTSR